MKKIISIGLVVAFLMTLQGCAGMSHQEGKTKTGVLVGAGLGAAAGQAIGRDTKGTLIGAALGAAVGGIAGNRIGAYMDQQEQALRNAVAATDAASIQRSQDVLTATFKSDYLFDFDSSILKPGAYAEVDRVGNVLVQYPETMIRVEGHTDTKGNEQYNQRLSERRAESVKGALVQRGVNPARIQTIGFGKSQPVSSVDALNRRVSVVIIPVERGW
jgi:outer membrane protein OmpA-like peptidoglycan-associated protein